MFLRSPFAKRSILMTLLFVSLFLIAARPLQAPSLDVSILVQIALAAFTALVGWPALLSVIVTALEFYQALTPSTAETFMFWANVVVFGAIFVLAILGKLSLVNNIDVAFGLLAKVLADVLILLGVPLGFRFAHAHVAEFRSTNMFQRGLLRHAK